MYFPGFGLLAAREPPLCRPPLLAAVLQSVFGRCPTALGRPSWRPSCLAFCRRRRAYYLDGTTSAAATKRLHQFGKDFGGVFTELWCWPPKLPRGRAKDVRCAGHEHGRLHIFTAGRDKEAAIVPVWVGKGLIGGVHDTPRLPPFLAAAIAECGIVSFEELLRFGDDFRRFGTATTWLPCRRAVESWLVELPPETFGLEPLLDLAPGGVVAADAEHEESSAIGCAVEPRVGAVRRGVTAGLAKHIRTLVEPVRHAYFRRAAQRLVHRRIDVLALAGGIAVVERHKDTDRGEVAGRVVSLVALAVDGRS